MGHIAVTTKNHPGDLSHFSMTIEPLVVSLNAKAGTRQGKTLSPLEELVQTAKRAARIRAVKKQQAIGLDLISAHS